MAQGIGRASMLLASGTMVSRVLGFVKAIVLAQTIGVVGSASADAFANANSLPSNIYSIIAGGVLNAVLVPQVVRAAKHPDGGQTYINRLVTLAIVVMGTVAALATLAAPILSRIYGASLDQEQLSLVIAFAFWCLPQIFFYGLQVVLGEVLNARGLFGPFAWAPVVNNLVSIAGLVTFSVIFGADPEGNRLISEWTPEMIALLGGGMTLGVAVQALVLFPFWRKVGLTYRPDFHFRGTGLGKAGRLVSWTFGMLLILQLSGVVETIVANIAFGQAASVAAMQNAFLIFVLPHSIVTVSITTAYFTRMSEAAGDGRLDKLVRDFSTALRLVGLFIVFAGIALMVISPAFARVFESQTDGVFSLALILCAFLLGLVAFCALFLVQRVFFALEDTRTQFWLYLTTAPVHIFGMALASLLPVEYIVAGLALMQTVMNFLRLAIMLAVLRMRLGPLGLRQVFGAYTQFFIAAIVAGLVGVAIMWGLGTYNPAGGFAISGVGQALLSCAVGGVAMALVYFAGLWLLRSPDLRNALEPVLGRIRGRGAARDEDDFDDFDDEFESRPGSEVLEAYQSGLLVAERPADPPERVLPVDARSESGAAAQPSASIPPAEDAPWWAEVRDRRAQRVSDAETRAATSSWAMGATEDLSTMGIILPAYHKPEEDRPLTRRELRARERAEAARNAAVIESVEFADAKKPAPETPETEASGQELLADWFGDDDTDGDTTRQSPHR